MPARWSALELSQKLDEAEAELAQANERNKKITASMTPFLSRFIVATFICRG
jgi:hypothetical protein